ncbi:signal recognition particle-docking protein FtsY [Shinella sp. 838]|jgi:fused signal recognition particle receptor|uniref:signal recognition particle-docking protein FtsY n=1 Tax=unclassified Shinella TaxID=2643062 RepID=UPI0003C53F4F|nr:MULTISPECIES: signal recognition particle-docking protein FtsY [unclassified Shinella]EYR79677.1 signal recognition particle receptor FtsY [Shinella sp. DD12]MCA0343407.1 signal recognition particle-docking protein FtsY [Pseudomonadota bacterium]MDG4673882.1 signal recognition particle-docking protein FtsY [Shinella sp. 838]
MALGFIKKIFTFGKDTAPEQKPEVEAPAVARVEDATPEPVAEILEPVAVEERDALLDEAEAANPEAAHHVPDETEPDIYPLPHAPELPVAEDPVAPAEIETAGGPADDVPAAEIVEEVAEEEPAAPAEEIVEAEPVATEEAAEPENEIVPVEETIPTEVEDRVLEEAMRSEPRAEAPVLPKGFATVARELAVEASVPQVKRTWFQRLRDGLARTSSQLTGQITSLFTKRKLDDDTLQDLEDLLIQADLGVETALRITDTLASERYGKDVTGSDVSRIMASEITKVLGPVAKPLALDLNHKPHVILVVGVNGTGKTTTIGKLAAKLSGAGLKVMMAAGDTFRAAAIEQLKIWAERTGSDIVSSKLGADAAGLAYEAYEQAKLKKSDVLIIDTAGRLQNKTELMAELEKIVRVLGKLDPDAPHTVLQTLDATTGQNAMNQVEIFRNVAGVTGLIMTKLDGTARGGILVAIAAKHKLPVYFIGVGEGIDDLEPFEAKDFAEAIAGVEA